MRERVQALREARRRLQNAYDLRRLTRRVDVTTLCLSLQLITVDQLIERAELEAELGPTTAATTGA